MLVAWESAKRAGVSKQWRIGDYSLLRKIFFVKSEDQRDRYKSVKDSGQHELLKKILPVPLNCYLHKPQGNLKGSWNNI